MACDIKESSESWNKGVDAFNKAFKLSGGKNPTDALNFAMDEVKKSNPELDFDVKSFTDPIIEVYQKKGLISKNYKYGDSGKHISSAKKKIDRMAEKMNGLSQDQKKDYAKKIFSSLEKDGSLNDEQVKNIYASALGLPHSDEKLDKQITETSKALQENKSVEDEIQQEIKNMQSDKDANEGKLTSEQDAKYEKIFSDLGEKRAKYSAKMMDETANFSEILKEKKFWLHQLGDYMPLNLMNPNSLSKNVSGAVVDFVIRSMGNSMAPIVSKTASIFTGVHSNPLGAKIKGVFNSKGREKAKLAWKHGVTDFNNELPTPNHLQAANRFRQAMDATGIDKLKGFISSALKVHPMFISKGLTVPDAIAYEWVHSAEVNRIAEAKGLKGAEKKAFMLDPDEKTLEVAGNLAKNATFKQDLPKALSFLKEISSYDPHKRSKEMIKAGTSPLWAKISTGIRAILQKSAMPFVKTPINIVRVASKVLLPEYALANDLYAAKKETDTIERQRLIVEGTTKFVAGMFVRNIALNMIAQGLISAGYGDEDKKTKDIIEQQSGGPNRINYSALVRGLTFREMKMRKGDHYVDLNSLGAFGITMAVYAHAFNKYGKDEIEQRTQYNKDLMNAVSIPSTLLWASLSSSLDFTFFTGINQLHEAIVDNKGNRMNYLAANYVANLFTGVLPSTYQKFSTQIDPNVKKQFDNDLDFHENLKNVLGYRFFFQSKNLRDKYFSLKEADEAAVKKKEYMFFDNYMGRVLEAEFDFPKVTTVKGDNPISRLHEALKGVSREERDKLFPASISDKISIPVRRGGKTKSVNVELTPAQFDYIQKRASTYRMMLATPFIMSEDFKNADYDVKTKVLQGYYQEGLKNAKQDLKKEFPDMIKQGTVSADKKTVKKLSKKYKTKASI